MNNTKKQERQKKIRGYLYDFGKLFVDISKLAFGSLVLGSVIRWNIPQMLIFTVGIAFSGIVAVIGIILVRKYEEN